MSSRVAPFLGKRLRSLSDLCCTSANAVTLVENVLAEAEEIIFVPDQNLAHFVSRRTGRQFIAWEGYCPVHAAISPQDIRQKRNLFPKAEVLVHPECIPAVVDLADQVLSTEGMIAHVRSTGGLEFIIGTEQGIIHRLRQENPDKTFYQASSASWCPNMKKITLEKVLYALEEEAFEVTLVPHIMSRARESIHKMLDYRD